MSGSGGVGAGSNPGRAGHGAIRCYELFAGVGTQWTGRVGSRDAEAHLVANERADGMRRARVWRVMSPDFPLYLTGISPGKHLFSFLVINIQHSRALRVSTRKKFD